MKKITKKQIKKTVIEATVGCIPRNKIEVKGVIYEIYEHLGYCMESKGMEPIRGIKNIVNYLYIKMNNND